MLVRKEFIKAFEQAVNTEDTIKYLNHARINNIGILLMHQIISKI